MKLRTPFKPIIPATIIVFLLVLDISAQNSLYTNYTNSHIYNINPAAAGFDASFISQLTVSKKWLGVNGSPSGQVFSNSIRLGEENFYDENMFINRPIINFADRVGIGLTVYNDNNGPLKHTGLLFAYAYHIPFRENRLSLGLSSSMTQHYLNTQLFKPINAGDPELYTNNKAIVPEVNFGILFHNPGFFSGLAINNIANLNKTMDHKNTFPSVVAHGGVIFKINSTYKIEPSLYLWKIPKESFSSDFNVRVVFRNRNWILLSYQNYNTFLAGIYVSISKGIQMGYSYALSTQGFSAYYSGNQSFTLRADIAALINKH